MNVVRRRRPSEAAEMALRIKGQGSRAINLRSSFGTLRDDVRLVELVRHAVGDDFHILTDGNEAPGLISKPLHAGRPPLPGMHSDPVSLP
jgi:L-alanine-DL-glutamate epimerase-like enolase superfamily enzyme